MAINREIRGHCAGGVTNWDLATVAEQALTCTVTDNGTGSVQNYGPELLSSLAVTVSGGAIQSATMFAMVNGSVLLYIG